MKKLLNRRLVIAVLTIACLTTVLLVAVPTRSSGPAPGEYDAWLDWDSNGKIDMIDISHAAKAFGRSGTNVSKASLSYDSGWLDLRNETRQYYTITHNLNDTELQVDAREITPGWNQTYGGTRDDEANALVQTSDGGYALAGRFGGGIGWLVKTDANGIMQWSKTYEGTDLDNVWALVQTTDGGYALAGDILVKTDVNGNMQWEKTYGGEAMALVQTADGGYALAGDTSSFGAGYFDFWLVKTDVESGLAWVDSSANTITLYRGATDPYWNYVRVRLWKPR